MQQIKQDKKAHNNGHIGIRISKENYAKIMFYEETTGIGKSTLGRIAVHHFLVSMDQIKKELENANLGKSMKDLFEILNQRFFNFATYPLKSTLNSLPYEERIQLDLEIESAKRRKNA